MPLMAGDFEVITVSTVPIGFTASKLLPTSGQYLGKKAERVECTLETDQIRFQKHIVANQTLSASVGHIKNVFNEWAEKGHATLFNYRMIRSGSDDAHVTVSYYYQV